MTESKTSTETSSSSEKMTIECPFERDGVRDGIRKLTREDGLIEQLLIEVRSSNRLSKYNNKLLKTVARLFALAVLILIAVGLLAWKIFDGVALVEGNLNKSIREQRKLVDDVNALLEQAKKTDDKLDDAKEALDSQPKVELVAENDPEKAKEAPIKVRIIPPKNPAAGDTGEPSKAPPTATQTAVEVPLPVKDVKTVPPEKKR